MCERDRKKIQRKKNISTKKNICTAEKRRRDVRFGDEVDDGGGSGGVVVSCCYFQYTENIALFFFGGNMASVAQKFESFHSILNSVQNSYFIKFITF